MMSRCAYKNRYSSQTVSHNEPHELLFLFNTVFELYCVQYNVMFQVSIGGILINTPGVPKVL